MTSTLRNSIVGLVAAGAMLVPAFALAASAQTGYSTTLQATDPATKTAFFFGTLQLTVSDGGTIHGWYQAQYDGSYTPVTGSYKDGKYWLTIGNGAFQVYATKMRDGTLSGTATNTAIVQNQPSFATTSTSAIANGNLNSQISRPPSGTSTDTAIVQSQASFATMPASPIAQGSLYPQTFEFFAKPTAV